jgi:hypothetical protein
VDAFPIQHAKVFKLPHGREQVVSEFTVMRAEPEIPAVIILPRLVVHRAEQHDAGKTRFVTPETEPEANFVAGRFAADYRRSEHDSTAIPATGVEFPERVELTTGVRAGVDMVQQCRCRLAEIMVKDAAIAGDGKAKMVGVS